MMLQIESKSLFSTAFSYAAGSISDMLRKLAENLCFIFYFIIFVDVGLLPQLKYVPHERQKQHRRLANRNEGNACRQWCVGFT
jgi:hypothetical protein